jgi:hypothetical protein
MVRKTTRPPSATATADKETTGLPASRSGGATLPNAPDLRGLARVHAAAAVEALAAVMCDPAATPAARVSAAGALLAWGYGKAAALDDGVAAPGAAERIVRLVWGGEDG